MMTPKMKKMIFTSDVSRGVIRFIQNMKIAVKQPLKQMNNIVSKDSSFISSPATSTRTIHQNRI
jgi:hypothetical protein